MITRSCLMKSARGVCLFGRSFQLREWRHGKPLRSRGGHQRRRSRRTSLATRIETRRPRTAQGAAGNSTESPGALLRRRFAPARDCGSVRADRIPHLPDSLTSHFGHSLVCAAVRVRHCRPARCDQNVMIIVIGFIIVTGSVLGGFLMGGGHLIALMHPNELIIICGGALGAMVVMSPKKVLKDHITG